MYASLGKCGIANISLSCSQAILGITSSKNVDTEYLYYILSYIEETVKEFGQTGTQTNLSKQLATVNRKGFVRYGQGNCGFGGSPR